MRKRKLISMVLLLLMIIQLIPSNSYANSRTLDYRRWQYLKDRKSPYTQFKLDLKRNGVIIESKTSARTRELLYNEGETPPDIRTPQSLKAYVGDTVKSTNLSQSASYYDFQIHYRAPNGTRSQSAYNTLSSINSEYTFDKAGTYSFYLNVGVPETVRGVSESFIRWSTHGDFRVLNTRVLVDGYDSAWWYYTHLIVEVEEKPTDVKANFEVWYDGENRTGKVITVDDINSFLIELNLTDTSVPTNSTITKRKWSVKNHHTGQYVTISDSNAPNYNFIVNHNLRQYLSSVPTNYIMFKLEVTNDKGKTSVYDSPYVIISEKVAPPTPLPSPPSTSSGTIKFTVTPTTTWYVTGQREGWKKDNFNINVLAEITSGDYVPHSENRSRITTYKYWQYTSAGSP